MPDIDLKKVKLVLHKGMKDNRLDKKHRLQSLWDDLAVIARFDDPNQRCHCSDMTPKQQELTSCFGVESPYRGSLGGSWYPWSANSDCCHQLADRLFFSACLFSSLIEGVFLPQVM